MKVILFKSSLFKRVVQALPLVGVIVLMACSDVDKTEPNAEVKANSNQSLVVYSSRSEHLIKPVFDLYAEQTGVKIKYATDKAGVLIERIKAEGEHTPADVLITVDAGTLGYAASQGIFQAVDSDIILRNVPAHLRDANNLWIGLSLRARTIVYSTERVNPKQLSSYKALGDSRWHGKLCLRTSKKVYNQSLVAMLISAYGENKAQTIVESWVANLAIDPTVNDTQLMEAIIAGQCDLGLVNSYYFGRLQNKVDDLPLALFWPNQTESVASGVHINVAGAGVLKYSKNVDQAKAFIEWLVSDDAQSIFAGVNQEYPVNPAIPVDPQVASWGSFNDSKLPLSNAYKLQPAAVKLMDRAGYK